MTKLTRSYTPLIRSQIGDEISVERPSSAPLERFSSVDGRAESLVPGIHGFAVFGAIGQAASVLQFQLVKHEGRPVMIRVRTESSLTAEQEGLIRSGLRSLSDELAALPIVEVEDISKIPAGKTRRCVEE